MRPCKRLVILAACAGLSPARRLSAAAAAGQSAASVDTAIKSSWATAAPDWQPRLAQDETQKACSQYRNAPPKAVADAILAREKATIIYPADGKLMGDWKKGEKLAQSGYGGRFTDYPPRAEQRRQLLRLPPARRQGAELRHAGAEPAGVRQDPQVRRGRDQGGLRADLQPAGRHSLREHAAPGCQQVPDHRADQGPGGLS